MAAGEYEEDGGRGLQVFFVLGQASAADTTPEVSARWQSDDAFRL
jgi:hypothetical protein